jgi:hypothetical protein
MTLHFHDVSNFQPNYTPTGPTIAKATEGTDFVDNMFASNRQLTEAGGWPFIGYHFLRHGNVQAQVTHAISVVGNGQPLMLDVETAVDGSVATLADVLLFMDLYAQQSGGGRVTLVYLPEWYWSGHIGSPDLTPIAQRGAALISSDYTPYTDNGPGWQPYGGMTPVLWQWTSTPLDTNAYKGTQDQLRAVFNGAPVTTPRPPIGDDMLRYAFGASFTDRPPELADPGGPVIVVTDGCGAYFVQAVSYQLNEVVGDAAPGSPIITVERAPSTHHKLPMWTFAQAFDELTGGCVFDPNARRGLAPWRKTAAGGSAPVTLKVDLTGTAVPA